MDSLDPTSNPAFIIFALVAPMLIAVFKQTGLPRQVNALIAFLGYIVVGIGGAIASGQTLTLDNAVQFVTVAVVVGTAAYKLLWSNLGANTATDPSIEEKLVAATSILKPNP